MSLLVGTAAGAFRLNGTPEPLIEGTRINNLAVDADGWWAVDGKGRIYRNGEVLETMPERSTALCIQPTPDTTWIGADKARLFALGPSGITEDEFFAHAPKRDKWYTPWGAPADVRSMALDADHTLYINVHVGGVLRYDNSGLVPT
ncbi:MAG: hypothetical protein V3U46_09650, partial [Acidimicrobiia bacterium]